MRGESWESSKRSCIARSYSILVHCLSLPTLSFGTCTVFSSLIGIFASLLVGVRWDCATCARRGYCCSAFSVSLGWVSAAWEHLSSAKVVGKTSIASSRAEEVSGTERKSSNQTSQTLNQSPSRTRVMG